MKFKIGTCKRTTTALRCKSRAVIEAKNYDAATKEAFKRFAPLRDGMAVWVDIAR